MEEAANESGLKDATKTLNSITDLHKKTKFPIKEKLEKKFFKIKLTLLKNL